MADYSYHYGEILLDVKNLHVSYGDNEILRGVEFQIKDIIRPGCEQGQVDALLAPSGMGKSQCFRCIAGLQQPTSGQVLINYGKTDSTGGAVLSPVKTGCVGVVAQDYPLFAHRTVLDNVMLAAKLKISNHDEALATSKKFLERFEMSDRANLYPHQISGGQRQRVAIIQQIICNNSLLLMDEPFSGLDILMKTEVQNLIVDVAGHNEHMSVIVTTHDIQSAISVADTIMLLGRDRDASGNVVPGAYIKYRYDLIALGLTWHPDISSIPAFTELEHEIKARFKEL